VLLFRKVKSVSLIVGLCVIPQCLLGGRLFVLETWDYV
jgi:hypothetical protein